MTIDPDRATEILEMANRARNNQEFEDSVRLYSEAIDLGCSQINDALYYRGASLLELGSDEKALVDLEECKHRGGTGDASLYVNLGACLGRLGRKKEALSAYEAGIKMHQPDRNGLLYNNIGYVYVDLEQLDKAISAFSKALGYRFYGCTDDLGRLINQTTDLDKGIHMLESFISRFGEMMPASPLADLYFWIGICSFEIEVTHESPDYSKAIKVFNIAINEESNLKRSLYYRGKANLYADNFEAAIQDFTDLIESECEAEQGRDPYAHYHRAKALACTGQYLLSLIDLDIALSLNDQDSEFYFFKGCILQRIGREEQACEAWGTAMDLGHQDAEDLFESYQCVRSLVVGRRT